MPIPRHAAIHPTIPQYAEVAPSPALAPWVACYWSIRAADLPPVPNRVLPDGCADVIIGLTGEPQPVVVGAMQTAAVVPLSGRVDLFGVRFRPGCALPFLGVPLRELTDDRVPLEVLWRDAAGALADAVALATPAERVAGAERVLRHRLQAWPRDRRGDEALAARAVSVLRRAQGGVGVRAVAAALGVGERRLERAFDRAVGLSPKVFGRVLRFRHAVREIERVGAGGRAPVTWPAVAFAVGYADQSHLIREFNGLAGVTPVRYVAERWGVGSVQYGGGEST